MNEIRKVLLDPTIKGQIERQEIVIHAALIQVGSGFVMGGFAILAAVNFLAMRSFPIIAVFGLVSSLGISVAAHEVMAISRNLGETMKGEGVFGNCINRLSAAVSEGTFMQAMTKDTWIVGPLFGSAIETSLKELKG